MYPALFFIYLLCHDENEIGLAAGKKQGLFGISA